MAIQEERAPNPPAVGNAGAATSPLQVRLFEQLKQRNVFRVAALYLVVCWLILEPVHVVFHMLEVPAWANRLVIMLMAVGFPAALIFAWVYEITPAGLRPTVEVPHGESIRKLTGRRLDFAIIAVLALALAYFVLDKFWISKRLAAVTANAAATSESRGAAAFNPPAHSIAVLPFINLSGDQAQEYFSDGLTEELLNALAEINGLQVAARTSAFSFKGKDNDIGSIARKLNVAAILEGSVRRSEQKLRVTAQLINAVTGFHLWSKTYDRDLGDVLVLQTEIANAVAAAMKVTLLGDETAKIELGGTRNPEAFDAYLRAAKLTRAPHGGPDVEDAIAAFSEAIRLDSGYALAYAGRSLAYSRYGTTYASPERIDDARARAQADARQATTLAPDLAESHLAAARVAALGSSPDFATGDREYQRAVMLAPGNAQVLSVAGRYATQMGRLDAGIAQARRALVLDPLNATTHFLLGDAYYDAHRYEEARTAYRDALALDPEIAGAPGALGLAHYALGDLPAALATCESSPDSHWSKWLCLAVTYRKVGRHADAENVVAHLRSTSGDSVAYQFADIYAQWGDTARALAWLEKAMRLHDPGLVRVKGDPLVNPLRGEPRFQAILRELRFPD